MTTGVTCTVLVNGVRAPDGSDVADSFGPVVLDNLSVTWGRADTMSQPETDSCSFQVLDVSGNDFAATFRTGARVDVVARGDTFAEADVPTFSNPGFETSAVTWAATGGSAQRTSQRVLSGAQALRLRPSDSAAPCSVVLAPAAFEPPGTNPEAWDDIPTTSLGQSWNATINVWLPRGSVAELRPALFSGPYAAAMTVIGPPVVLTGADAWINTTTEYVVQQSQARWVGLQLRFYPVGYAWNEMPPAQTWDTTDPALTWDDFGTLFIDEAQVTSPGAGSGRSVLVFSGRITELTSAWDDSANAPVISVTANGFTADLQNRAIGDEPWAVESVDARAHRILSLVAQPITIDIDETLAPILLSWRDVDSQGPLELLQQIATSVDGVLWPAVHSSLGAYLRLESPSQRASLLTLDDNGGVIDIIEAHPGSAFELSACDVLRDPISWVQNVSDIATRVGVTWKQQGVDDDGKPTTTDVTERVVDAALELLHGARGVSVSTELQASADATNVAQRVLTRTSSNAWHADNLTLDDEDLSAAEATINLVLDLLDGTSRIGAPIIIEDMPAWAPSSAKAGVYLEGGKYSFIGGRWVLELNISSATGLGGSAEWNELDPTWTWNMWNPQLTWNDLHGASAPS